MLKLFDKKRKYTGNDGDEYIDLSIPVVKISDIRGNSVETLSPDHNGRLDKFVWNNVENNFDMIDIVMYANHIFNPFSVKEGDILNIPFDNEELYKESDEPTLPDGSKHSKNSRGEKEMTYAEKIAYMAKNKLGLK